MRTDPDSSMSELLQGTIVVTVTYGERFHLLEQVVRVLRSMGICKVIVVDNASGTMSRQKLEQLSTASDGWLNVVSLRENKGSAGGFRAGLERANQFKDCEFIWLLDDDNCPARGAFTALESAWRFLGCNPENALLCFRSDRTEYVHACTQGVPVKYICNSFLGFHTKDLVRKVGKVLSLRSTPSHIYPIPLVPVEYAPYGGFFVHRSWIDRIGLPNEQFYLYGDDHEFTSRITKLGGRIYLCHDAQVSDLEVTWSHKHMQAFESPVNDERRIYYTLRNRVWFEKSRVTSTLVYTFNALTYLIYLLLLNLVRNRSPKAVLRRYKIMARAVNDGWFGNLGEIDLIDIR